jgi:hypothetical protein
MKRPQIATGKSEPVITWPARARDQSVAQQLLTGPRFMVSLRLAWHAKERLYGTGLTRIIEASNLQACKG